MPYSDPNDPRIKASQKRYYDNNRQRYRDHNKAQDTLKRQWVLEQKDVPCMDCGVKYPYYVMDFDHRDPALKETGLTRWKSLGWARLEAEVAKCDVVCANCHRIRTHKHLLA